MRYIPIRYLKPGMICGKNIIGKNGQVLLKHGVIIEHAYIEKIKFLDFHGIYIEDALSEDIEVTDVITEALRTKSIKLIKNLFTDIETDRIKDQSNVQQLHQRVDEMLDQILKHRDVQLNLLDLKFFDDYTYAHSVNTTVLSLLTGISLKENHIELRKLGASAMLHDMGKFFISKEILNKPGRLSAQEHEKIQKHSEYGYEYLKKQCFVSPEILTAVIDHHEKIDGTGYPHGKKDNAISRHGRIIAVCDVFDALTSDRPYRKALPPSEAIEFLLGGSSIHFDTDVIQAFMKRIVPYSPGVTVILSNQSLGVVVRNHPSACLRPVIRVYKTGGKLIDPYTVDLFNDRSFLDVTILGIHQ